MTTICRPLANTGASICPFLMKVGRRVILVPTIGSDGTANGFDTIAEVTKTALQAKFDAEDPLDRFYPLPVVENVENIRAETVFFEWNSGQKVRIRQGPRTFKASLPSDHTDTTLIKRLQAWYGQSFGVYIIDKAGNFIYDKGDSGEVMPMAVDGNSFDLNLVTETYSEPLFSLMQFDFSQDLNDGDIYYIPVSSLDFDGLGTDFYGLWDLTVTATAIATATTFSVETVYAVPVTGLLVGDISIYNNTTSATVTVDTLTESPTVPGTYVGAHASGVTATDSITLTINKTKYEITDTDITVSS